MFAKGDNLWMTKYYCGRKVSEKRKGVDRGKRGSKKKKKRFDESERGDMLEE